MIPLSIYKTKTSKIANFNICQLIKNILSLSVVVSTLDIPAQVVPMRPT